MVTNEGFLGKIFHALGLSPEQVDQRKNQGPNSEYMSKEAYLTLLDSLHTYERDIPRVLSAASKQSILDDDKREIVNFIRRFSNRKQITPKSTAANLIGYVNQFSDRVNLKIQAKLNEDRKILERKRQGIVTKPVKSRTHTNKGIIDFVELLINELSSRMANMAKVNSRSNMAYRAKEKARVQAAIKKYQNKKVA